MERSYGDQTDVGRPNREDYSMQTRLHVGKREDMFTKDKD